MSGASFNFNNNVSGQGANIAQGQTVTQNVTQSFTGAGPNGVTKLFDDLAVAAEKDQPEFAAEHHSLTEEFQSPADMLRAARAEAEADIEASSEPALVKVTQPDPQKFAELQQTWFTRFQAIAPAVLKVALAGGQAVLDSYVTQSPVVAGLRAAVAALKE